MFNLVPPAGTPTSYGDIIRVILSRIQYNSRLDIVHKDLKTFFGVEYLYLVNSGRTALTLALQSLSSMADGNKKEVILPAYTCFSVAAAVARSGLRIRLVDIDPMTMDYVYENFGDTDFSNVLAIVACNMFGTLSNWEKLRSIAGEKDVFLIDDAAQSMGSTLGSDASGTLGDIGFYSLGRGKNMTTYSGGILVTNNADIAARIENRMAHFAGRAHDNEILILMKLLLYGLFLKPRLYWLAARIPYLGLGATVFDETFIMRRLSPLQICAAGILYTNLERLNKIRLRNAKLMADRLLKSDLNMIPGYKRTSCPAYLRLPVLVHSKERRDRLLVDLRKKGIVASTMYPSTISRIPYIEKYLASGEMDYPGAETVVNRLICLPTHPYLREKDISNIFSCLVEGR